MKFNNPYFSTTAKIQLLQKWILVHSVIYYELDESIVDDNTYDMNEVQLAKLMQDNPKAASKSKYADCFRGFDGSTGFDLYKRLTVKDRREVYETAQYVLSLHKEK